MERKSVWSLEKFADAWQNRTPSFFCLPHLSVHLATGAHNGTKHLQLPGNYAWARNSGQRRFGMLQHPTISTISPSPPRSVAPLMTSVVPLWRDLRDEVVGRRGTQTGHLDESKWMAWGREFCNVCHAPSSTSAHFFSQNWTFRVQITLLFITKSEMLHPAEILVHGRTVHICRHLTKSAFFNARLAYCVYIGLLLSDTSACLPPTVGRDLRQTFSFTALFRYMKGFVSRNSSRVQTAIIHFSFMIKLQIALL